MMNYTLKVRIRYEKTLGFFLFIQDVVVEQAVIKEKKNK